MFKKNKPAERPRSRQSLSQNQRTAVFSYYNNRQNRADSPEKPKEALKRPRKQSWVRKTSTFVFLVAGAGLVIVSLIVTPQPQIKVVGDTKTQAFLQDDEVYRSAAQQILADSAFNRNKLTFDSDEIIKQMRQTFPELAAVSVSLPVFGWQPTVYVQAFSPSVVLVGSSTGDFVLDPDGRAFAPDGLKTGLDKLQAPVVRDQSGLNISERQIALPSDQVAFITEVYQQLKAQNVEIAGITLPVEAGELHIQVRDKPYVVRFNLYGNAREGAGRYLATASYLESKGETPGEYIDVRVDGRVFYK